MNTHRKIGIAAAVLGVAAVTVGEMLWLDATGMHISGKAGAIIFLGSAFLFYVTHLRHLHVLEDTRRDQKRYLLASIASRAMHRLARISNAHKTRREGDSDEQ